jgi:hypothetical protein
LCGEATCLCADYAHSRLYALGVRHAKGRQRGGLGGERYNANGVRAERAHNSAQERSCPVLPTSILVSIRSDSVEWWEKRGDRVLAPPSPQFPKLKGSRDDHNDCNRSARKQRNDYRPQTFL